MDGFGGRRVSDGTGIAMLPAFGPDAIWFARLTTTGMFITNARMNNRSVIESTGLNMRPSICDGRVYFSSTRDGNSEIYSARLDGTQVRRLTNHPAIDVSPDCGPGGKIAFVSSRHGTPQVFVMRADGSEPTRVTFRGNHNQTPAWCPDPNIPLIAFTGRDEGLDIFTVNVNTQEYTRLTQAQGANKDPAFSRDCRLVAFASDRRSGQGIYLASPQGFNQNRVLSGAAETLQWSR
jgi:TolB protein